MREIKFRIWNPYGNNMLYDIDNVFGCLKQQIKFDKSMPDRGFVTAYDHKGEGMVWMQYTGLKDKNGVEIYEGDIVKKDRLVPLIGVVTYKTESARFWVSIPKVGQKDDWTFIGDNCEVIGNIHSNPELLK